MLLPEAQLAYKHGELLISQGLGKPVCHHVICRYPFELYRPSLYLIPHEMPLDINMLRPSIKRGSSVSAIAP